MIYLLDTNICIFVIRRKSAAVLARFEQFGVDELAISAITLAELRYGADKSNRPEQNHAAVDAFLVPVAVVDFDSYAAARYGTLRADLERRGSPIGPLDTLIAACALSLGVPLATNNVAEFSHVPGLQVEDWTR